MAHKHLFNDTIQSLIIQHLPHRQILSENKNSVFAAGADGYGKAVDQYTH